MSELLSNCVFFDLALTLSHGKGHFRCTHESARFGIERSLVYRRENNFPAWADTCAMCAHSVLQLRNRNQIAHLYFDPTLPDEVQNVLLDFHLLLSRRFMWVIELVLVIEKLMRMIEGFLIVTFSKCNNPWVDKNQQTPTLTADFQIRHQKMLRLQILIPSVSLNSYFKLSGREMTI